MTEPVAMNIDLERAIENAPHKDDVYLVYADFLQAAGDPRGELITLQANAERLQEADAFLRENERYFVGDLLAKGQDAVSLEWRLGFIRAAKVMVLRKHEDEQIKQAPLLDTLLALPSSRFLRDLTVGCLSIHEDNFLTANVNALVRGGPRPLLQCLTFDVDTEEEMLSWAAAGDLGALWPLYPNLEALRIVAGSFELGEEMHLPKLESLSLETCALSSASLQAVASTEWPALEELEIWFGSVEKGATAGPAGLASLLQGDLTPNLSALGLCNSEAADDICAMLAESPLLGRVLSLDLRGGTMTDAGAHVLARAIARLSNPSLRSIDLRENFLSDDALEELAELLPNIEIESEFQREVEVYEGTEFRYCWTPE